jgi:hypothetical protein
MKQEKYENWGDQVFYRFEIHIFGRIGLMRFMQNGKPYVSEKKFLLFLPLIMSIRSYNTNQTKKCLQ